MPLSAACFQRLIARMKEQEGCDAVVLGCTENPADHRRHDLALPTLARGCSP